ncbi:hypothetical protein L1887_20322 [Cichorium endivia]|nr:hypothetical protein L1887_20322 [Cichorium endivia]
MEVITGTSSMVATEFFTQTIELIAEVFTEANYVFVEKESFPELASYLNRLVPLLKELNKRDMSNAENTFLEILNQQVKVAKQLTTDCSKKNKVYLLISCRSITKRIQEITREISHALSLFLFPNWKFQQA